MKYFYALVLLSATSACQPSRAADITEPSRPGAETANAVAAKPQWHEFIKTQVVRASSVDGFVTTTGRLTFDEDHTQRIASPFDGRVASIMVRPGDVVKVGQTLLTLTSPQVAGLLAEHKKVAQDLTLATRALERSRTLQADGAVSSKDMAQASADYYKAQADVEGSAAQLRALGLDHGVGASAALTSRVQGTVVDRNVLTGQEVRADGADALLTITDLDTLWVLADVYEQDLGLVERGAKVRVRVPAYPGEVFEGEVAHIGDVVDPQSRTVKVRCVVPNPQHRLKPEMFAKVELAQRSDVDVILVPSKALLNDGDKVRVMVLANDQFTRREVQVGAEVNGQRRILQGVADGDVVVTDGAIFLQNEIY